MESARKAGIEGAAEFLDDPNMGLEEVVCFNFIKNFKK